MRTRRDHWRFLTLIATVAFLRQYQKEVMTKDGLEFIECDLIDYEIAYKIMINGVLSSTMIELPRSAVELYEEIRKLTRRLAKGNNLAVNEVSFTQRDIREATGFGNTWIKNNLKILVDFEYISLIRGGKERTRGFYRLKEDCEIQRLDLSMIPTPEQMRKKLQKV